MLPDLILFAHILIVAFNLVGLPAVWLGAWLGWRWVRNRVFRIVHVALMAFIALEAVFGVICPLTLWEDALRGGTTERSFISRWLAALLYWDWPAWVFTAIYVGWTLLIVLTWFLVPPRLSHSARKR